MGIGVDDIFIFYDMFMARRRMPPAQRLWHSWKQVYLLSATGKLCNICHLNEHCCSIFLQPLDHHSGSPLLLCLHVPNGWCQLCVCVCLVPLCSSTLVGGGLPEPLECRPETVPVLSPLDFQAWSRYSSPGLGPAIRVFDSSRLSSTLPGIPSSCDFGFPSPLGSPLFL